MQIYPWEQVEKEQLNPLFARQVIHGETVTMARVFLAKGCLVPRHSHVNEQLSLIEKGSLKFVFDDREVVVKAGEVLQIPPNVPHAALAEEDCEGIDFFAPVREDWRTGDDAYLRR